MLPVAYMPSAEKYFRKIKDKNLKKEFKNAISQIRKWRYCCNYNGWNQRKFLQRTKKIFKIRIKSPIIGVTSNCGSFFFLLSN